MVRCKFICQEITSFLGWDKRTLYKCRMNPVGGTSEENKAFYDATPGGSFEIATVTSMPFEIGGEYYIDISPA